ncbi:MAG: hypothetical protein M5U09_25000 [Gammaproteobacteria bacterium]|nr:hypothetical protein [Gammaproteobacteria bacterium]
MKWLDRLSVNWADYVDFLSLILVSYRLHKSSTREEVLRILREMEQRRESSRYDVRGWLQRNWAPDSPGFERVLEDIDSLDDRTRVQRAIADSFGIGNSRFLERARNLVVDQRLDGACGDGPWLIAAMRSHWGDVTSQSDARLSAALRQSFVDHLAQRWKHTLLEPSAETSSELSQALDDLLGILTRHADAALRSQREAAATELRSMEQAYQTDLRDAEQRYENVRSLLDEERQREPAPEGAGRDRQIVDAVVRFADDLDNLARAQSADQRLVAYILRKLDALLLAVSVERIGQLHQCLTGDQVDPTKYRSRQRHGRTRKPVPCRTTGLLLDGQSGTCQPDSACEIVQVRAVNHRACSWD